MVNVVLLKDQNRNEKKKSLVCVNYSMTISHYKGNQSSTGINVPLMNCFRFVLRWLYTVLQRMGC